MQTVKSGPGNSACVSSISNWCLKWNLDSWLKLKNGIRLSFFPDHTCSNEYNFTFATMMMVRSSMFDCYDDPLVVQFAECQLPREIVWGCFFTSLGILNYNCRRLIQSFLWDVILKRSSCLRPVTKTGNNSRYRNCSDLRLSSSMLWEIKLNLLADGETGQMALLNDI